MPSKREPNKLREWERKRRDRLKTSYQDLGKLLPCYDPSKPLTQIEIIHKASTYIEELKKQVEDLLSTEKNNKENVEREEVKKLYERIKKLLQRNEQLAKLLQDAGIKIPTECGLVKEFKSYKWSNKISPEKAKILAQKELQKENDPKKFKRRKAPNKANTKLKLITQMPTVVVQKKANKKYLANKKTNKKKTLGPQALITLPAQSCYILKNIVSTQNSSPITKANAIPSHSSIIPQKQQSIRALGPGTLIFPNGNIIPVLQQAALVPQQTIITNNPQAVPTAQPILIKQNQLNQTTVLVMPGKTDLTKETNTGSNKTALDEKINSITSRMFPRLRPKIGITKTTQINKLPIPALTSRYANSNSLFKSCSQSNYKVNKQKKISVANKTSKGGEDLIKIIADKDISALKEVGPSLESPISSKRKEVDDEILPEIKRNKTEANMPINNSSISSDDNKDPKTHEIKAKNCEDIDVIINTQMSTADNDSIPKTCTTSSYSIDSLCKDDAVKSSIAPINQDKNDDSAATTSLENIIVEQTKRTMEITQVDERSEGNTNIPENISSNNDDINKHKENLAFGVKDRLKQTTTTTIAKSFEETLKSMEKINVEKPNNAIKTKLSNKEKPTTIELLEDKNLDHLGHSELSNDLFASLQVPSGGQNPESTSPTAAFLLAFPLVSSLTGVKVTEVIEEETSDSRHDTPTLLQIGTMDTTKPTQSQSDSLTPSLLGLDNFPFFNSKDICGNFYNSFETAASSITSSTTTTTLPSSITSTLTNKPEVKTYKTMFEGGFVQKTNKQENAPDKSNSNICPQPVNKSAIIPLTTQNTTSNSMKTVDVFTSNHNLNNAQTPTSKISSITVPSSANNVSSIVSTMPNISKSASQVGVYSSINYIPPVTVCGNSSITTNSQTFKGNYSNIPFSQYNFNIQTTMAPSNQKYYSSTIPKTKVEDKLTSCSRYSSANSKMYANEQYNTLNPFTDITKPSTIYSYSTISQKYNDSVYSNSNYSYNYPIDNFDNMYMQPKSGSSKNDNQNYCNVNYEYSEFNKTTDETGNIYFPHNQSSKNKFQGGKATNSKVNNSHPRPPVNWMTTPDIKHNNQNANNELFIPQFSTKDIDFSANTLYPSNSFTTNTQNYFNPNAGLYPASDLHNTFIDTRKSSETFTQMQTNNLQRNDIEENQFNWSPTKLPHLVDPPHNFVSSTLPTLVGDLALGNHPPIFAENKQDVKSSKDAYRSKDTKRNKTQTNYDSSQTNFLSVSQLVDHNKPEPARVTSRRNSGQRSNKNQPKTTKRIQSKQSDNSKDLSSIEQNYGNNIQSNKQIQIKQHQQVGYMQNSNTTNNEWNTQKQISRNVNKNPSSSYSAEALIAPPNHSEEAKNRSNPQKYVATSKASHSVNAFFPDNIIPYFPSIDENTSYMQQNQNFQSTGYSHNLSTSIQTDTYSTVAIISTPTISSTYMPGTNFMPELMSHEYNPLLQDNLFSHSNARPNDQKLYKSNTTPSVKQSNQITNNLTHRDDKRNVAPVSTSACITNMNNSNVFLKKSTKKKAGNDVNIPGLVDFSTLFPMPGSINSPILPDDFHAHTSFLPPPTPTQLYPCKNPLYSKESNDLVQSTLIPLPTVTRTSIQHPEVSPSINSGTSLTNFNLSTIFPEINKGVSMHSVEVYPHSTRIKDYNIQRNYLPNSSQITFGAKTTFSTSFINTVTTTQSFIG